MDKIYLPKIFFARTARDKTLLLLLFLGLLMLSRVCLCVELYNNRCVHTQISWRRVKLFQQFSHFEHFLALFASSVCVSLSLSYFLSYQKKRMISFRKYDFQKNKKLKIFCFQVFFLLHTKWISMLLLTHYSHFCFCTARFPQ